MLGNATKRSPKDGFTDCRDGDDPKHPKIAHNANKESPIEHPQINWDVRPSAERKSKRGRKKRIPTEGYTCPNPRCCYFGITHQDTHAGVSHGKGGKYHNIQYFKCQACQKTFASRRGSVLYYLKTSADRVGYLEREWWIIPQIQT